MANDTQKIVALLISLVIIFGLLGWIVSYQLKSQDVSVSGDTSIIKEQPTLLQVMKNVSTETKRPLIVTDRFVGKIDKDAVVVAVSSNGEAYAVKSGVVLTNNMVISANDNSYSVQRLDGLSQTVSTN